MNTKDDRKAYVGLAKWLEYLLGRAIISLLMWMPVGMAYRLGRSLGWLFWLLLTGRRRTVRTNLKIIADWARESGREEIFEGLEIKQQAREVFMRNGANFTCGFSLSGMNQKQLAKHIDFVNGESLRKATEGGTGAVLLLSHMGPWEALAHLPGLFQAQGIENPLGAVYRRFNNDYMDHWYRSRRENRGTSMFISRYKFYAPVEFVRKGGILGVLSDQRASGGEEITYFGKRTTSSPLPGLIHLRTKVPWFALSLQTTGFAHWRITIHEVPSHLEGADRSRAALAQTSAAACQESLAESLYDGFWINKRFKDALEREAEARKSAEP